MIWILAIGGVDMLGRVMTLLYLMRHNEVRSLSYRTWVLLVAFLNFAFLFYWLFGRKREGEST